jgi:hypothetical protein
MAAQAVTDCWIGAVTLYVLYFGSTMVFLVLLAIDWLAGTRLTQVDWILPTKFTVLAAGLVWVALLWGPSKLAMLVLGADDALDWEWRMQAKRIRPMVGAITLCLGLYGGYQVWDHAPPLPQWEGEYVVPKTDVWLARSTAWSFETMARECLPQVDVFGIRRWHAKVLDHPPPPPLSARCNRPDVLEWARRWETDFLLYWVLEEAPKQFGEPKWREYG